MYDLDVDAGATFGTSFVFRNPDMSPYDFTGFTGKLQVRRRLNSDVVLETEPQLDEDGTVTFGFTAEETGTLDRYRYRYALELYGPDDLVIRVIEGRLNVSPRVVRH
jgi:hypothetical protein